MKKSKLEIIKLHASKEGLAHYSPKKDLKLENLKGILYENKHYSNELEKFIFLSGIQILKIGFIISKKLKEDKIIRLSYNK